MKTEETKMKCKICGEEFDPSELALVFLHMHDDNINPSRAMGIKGKKITTKRKTNHENS